jgi:hypothetical protein
LFYSVTVATKQGKVMEDHLVSFKDNQIVGNMGLYHVCYELSRLGWNVLPTSRNTRGVDIVIYSQDSKRKHTIQVKTLSKRNPVPLGSKPSLIADLKLII